LSAIRAQLKNIGRDSIPVEVYCFDSFTDGVALNTPELIKARLLEYLDQNVDAARRDKTAHLLRAALRNELLRLRTAEAALKKSEAERREIAKKIEGKIKGCDTEFQSLIAAMLDELDGIRNSASHKLQKDVSEAMLRRAKELESCQSFADVQQAIQVINIGLQNDVTQCFFDIGVESKKAVEALGAKYGGKAGLVSSPMQDALRAELDLDYGMLAKIPTSLMTIADILIPIIVLPTPFFVDLIIRHLATKWKFLSDFLPANFIANIIVSQVKDKLIGQQKEVIAMVCGKLDEAFAGAKAKTRESMETAWREETDAIRAGLDVKGAANDGVEAKRIGKAKAELEQALRGIDAN
jgi:hypothetical protein